MTTSPDKRTQGRPQPSVGRPKKYTRDQILHAALDVARSSGIDGLTMLRVASAIGTTPATLYRYVASHDELLAATVDLLVAQRSLPEPVRVDASAEERRAWLTEIVVVARDHFLTVRGVADYLLLNGPTGTAGLEFMSVICEVIAQTGRSPQEVAQAYDHLMTTVSAYTSKTERSDRAGGAHLAAATLTALHEAVSNDAALGAVLAEFTGDMDTAFRRATGRIIDWIVLDPPD